MIDWKEYISSKSFIKYRCNFCRKWFEEREDIQMHLIEDHEVMNKIEIKTCSVCRNPFVPMFDEQVICGRKDCILHENHELVEAHKK